MALSLSRLLSPLHPAVATNNELRSLPAPPRQPPAFSDYPSHPHAHSSPKSLLASTWQILDQPPPPSLREILGAYRSRGDGDREMLMAMLNAKSAEDQRIASMASLHRSMLEYYQVLPAAHPVAASESSSYSPVLQAPPTNGAYHARSTATGSSPSQSPRTARDPHPRKRHRSSESPASTQRSATHSHSSSSPYHAPSPPESVTSEYVDRSPRSRGAMAIGSLLREAAREETNGTRASRRDGPSDHAAARGRHSNPASTVSV